MVRVLQSLIVGFAIEIGLPCLYFAITGGPDAALACFMVMLVVCALSVPFIICSLPLWRMAQRLVDESPDESSPD